MRWTQEAIIDHLIFIIFVVCLNILTVGAPVIKMIMSATLGFVFSRLYNLRRK